MKAKWTHVIITNSFMGKAKPMRISSKHKSLASAKQRLELTKTLDPNAYIITIAKAGELE